MKARILLTALAALACAAPLAVTAAPAPEPAAPALRLAPPVERRLANGLRVVVFRVPSLPIVQGQLLVPAGAADEPDSLPGLAALTAQMLQLGSASRTTDQLAADLSALGATFTTSAGRDYALAACGSRAAVFESALEIMGDAVVSPRLDQDEFELARRIVVQQLRSKAQSVSLLADDRAWGAAFDPHPYGHADAGDIDALVASRLEHVRSFARDRWRPDRAVLAIAGDIEPERAFAAAEAVFGRWAGRTATDRDRPAPARAGGVHVLDLPGSPVGEVRVVVRGPGRASPERAAWEVAAAALEDRLAGTGASVTFTPLRDASLLVLAQGAPVDSARSVARRLTNALHAFATAPPAGDAGAALARRVARELPLTLETLGARVSRWQADDFSGLGHEALLRALATPAAAPDLAPVARACASPIVFAAGPGGELKRLLAPLGTVELMPLTTHRVSREDSLAAPKEAELAAGRKAIAAAIVAHGGAARLGAVQSIVYEGDIQLDTGGSMMEGQFSLVRIDPSRMSFATRMLEFEVRQVLDGDSGWTLAQGDSATFTEADSSALVAMRAMLHGDLVHLLRAAAAPGALPALRGKDKIGDQACDLVDFIGPGGVRLRLALATVSRRVLAVDAALAADLKWHERRTFSNWKTVSGLLLPEIEQRYLDAERVTYQRARTILVNTKIGDALFQRPRISRGQVIPSNK